MLLLKKTDARRFKPNACQKPIGFAKVTAGTRQPFQRSCVGQAMITDRRTNPNINKVTTASTGYLSFILCSLNVLEIIKIETVTGFL